MSLSSLPTPALETASTSTAGATRLRGRSLLLARAAWVSFAALTLVVFIASLPVYFTQSQVICWTATCPAWQITPDFARANQQLGFSLSSFAVAQVLLAALLELACFAVGMVIFWRRSDERIALVVALFLVIFVCDFNNNLDALAAIYPAWALPVRVVNFAGNISWWFVFALFPDGRFVPRWTRWFAFGFALLSVPEGLFPGSALDLRAQLGDVFSIYLAIQGFGLVGIQIYRYVRVSTQVQRQQTKWAVFGVATAFLVAGAIAIADPTLNNQAPRSFVDMLVGGVSYLVIFLVPLSIGIAILRYRLWDVDALINKALVYGLLTALLGALYAGLIIGLTSLAGAITGTANQPVALVISTLAIAALFTPARRRIQALIDRRFYRQKYDAARTLDAFSAALRSEVDLSELRAHLLAVVNETMQPAHVSLWLRPPEQPASSEQAYRLEPRS